MISTRVTLFAAIVLYTYNTESFGTMSSLSPCIISVGQVIFFTSPVCSSTKSMNSLMVGIGILKNLDNTSSGL